ncbi:DUF5335 family protein [Microvirga flavescens]|uniref:DUF5335 family protein n=1 Tax=Microvirga flavescens TaxID=2249811 RepID=UPI000DDBB9D8|nr:DUF5335 family protein [Microvirga flavescens]
MGIQKLNRDEWRAFCDRISKSVEGKVAEVRIVSPKLGNQTEARWLPFLGLVYDPRKDTIEIALEGLDHTITNPSEFYADESAAGLQNFEIIGADGVREIVTLKSPLIMASRQVAKPT